MRVSDVFKCQLDKNPHYTHQSPLIFGLYLGGFSIYSFGIGCFPVLATLTVINIILAYLTIIRMAVSESSLLSEVDPPFVSLLRHLLYKGFKLLGWSSSLSTY